MASLTSLPIELLIIVASSLSTPDLGSLRLTCKHVEKFLFNSFAHEFFSKRQFMLTQPSLQALVDISKHASLSRHLKHVIIGLDHYQQDNFAFRDQESFERHQQGRANQLLLLNTGLDREMLTEAFQNLSNLETIGLRDYSSRGRWRDGDTFWSSYGASTVYRETGVRLVSGASQRHEFNRLQEDLALTTRAFQTLVYALGKAARTPHRFEVLLRGRENGLWDNAFNVTAFTLPTIKPVLSNLKTLLLTLDLQIMQSGAYPGMDPTSRSSGLFLRRFLAHTPRLDHLRMNFKPQPHSKDEYQNFLRWLAEPITSNSNGLSAVSPTTSPGPLSPPPVALDHLQRIDFGMLSVDYKPLVKVIAKFAPTLRRLSLWKVTLDGRNISYPARYSFWAVFFDTIANIPGLDLDYLLVGEIKMIDNVSSYNSLNVDFTVPKHAADALDYADDDEDLLEENPQATDAVYENKVEYSGSETTAFMKGLVKRVHVHWPVVIPASNNSDEDEDDEDEDDDEDGEFDDDEN